MTVLDMDKVPNEEKSKFSETAEFGKTLPELNAGLVPIIEKIWTEEFYKMESKLKPYILLAPVAIILISIMGFGIANVMQSLGYMPYIGAENISFRFYKGDYKRFCILESLIFSLKTSFISSTVAVFL